MRAFIEEVRPFFCFSVTFILIFCILFLLTNFEALLTFFFYVSADLFRENMKMCTISKVPSYLTFSLNSSVIG